MGSALIKVAFVDGEELVWCGLAPTAPGQEALASKLIGDGRKALGLRDRSKAAVASTGYGRNLFPTSDLKIDEISAGSLGAFKRSGGAARNVINIGGQDIKAMHMTEDGQLLDFKMNDKCAAGTGRFFDLAAKLLDTPLEEFGTLSAQADEHVELNSTCVVFAESELVSLMARGVKRESIIRAINASVAHRAAWLLGRERAQEILWLDGGPAQNSGLLAAFEDELMVEVKALPEPLYTVAYGAAVSL